MKKSLSDAVADVYGGNDRGFRYSFYQHVVLGYDVLRILSSDGIEIDDRVKKICDEIDSVMDVDLRDTIDGRLVLRNCDRIRRNPFTVRRMRLLARLYGELYDLLRQDKRCRSYYFLVPVSNGVGAANLNGVLYAIREWLEWRSHKNWITLFVSWLKG